MKRSSLVVIFCLLSLIMGVTLAQDDTGNDQIALTGVKILWPPPITEMCGVIDIYGTVNVPNLVDWMVEAIELNEDLSVPENAGWMPLNQGVNENAVSVDVLVSIDTTAAPNGVYGLRLTANVSNDAQMSALHDVVAPIRVNNDIPNCPYDQPDRVAPPPPIPEDNTPYVMPAPGTGAANVRYCDLVDNERCPRVGLLIEGRPAEVQGLSANGTGWYLARLNTGNSGWIAPQVVTTRGDFSNIPRIGPPQPLPPRPKPARVAPVSLGIGEGRAICQQPFTVQVGLRNLGESTSPAGTVTVQNVHLRTGQVTYTGFSSYPSLAPGQSFTAMLSVNIDVYYNEEHEIRALNEGEELRFRYVLEQGSCGAAPPTAPQPPSPPVTRDFAPGECTVNAVANAPLHQFPNGAVIGYVGPAGGTFNVVRATRTNGELWFELPGEMETPGGWVRSRNAPSNQDVCQV